MESNWLLSVFAQSFNRSIPWAQLISELQHLLKKTGPRMRGLCYISTLLRDDEGKSMNFLRPFKRLVSQYGTALVSFSVTATSATHLASAWHFALTREVLYCSKLAFLFLSSRLAKLYPNKGLFHPLKRGIWLIWCHAGVSSVQKKQDRTVRGDRCHSHTCMATGK